MAVFSPFLLLWGRVARLAQNHVLHVVAAIGLVAAFRIPLLLPRTLVLALSTCISLLGVTARFSKTGPFLGVACLLVALDRLLFLSRPSLWSHPESAIALLFAAATSWRLADPATLGVEKPKPFSFVAILSLGSLLFAHQWLLLQSGALARLFALPVMPTALVCFAASVAGFAFPLSRRWMAVLPAGIALLLVRGFLVSTWTLALFAFFLSSLWRPTVAVAEDRPSATTVGGAVVVWFLHFLASIWTVAYNFVPFGGAFMRERTDWHLVVLAALAGLASLTEKESPPSKRERGGSCHHQAFAIAIVLLLLFAPVALIRLRGHLSVSLRAAKQARTDAGQIRSMIWAVHFGYDNFGRNSFEDIEHIIRSNNVNVIGLLESDLTRPFTDNWDIVNYLSETLGLHSDFGPSTLNNTWGCALLSAYPIVHVERWMLPR